MDDRRLQEIERKIDLLLNRFEISFQNPALPEPLRQVAFLAAQGKKIEAIAEYRRLTGASLADAKNFVDGLETEAPRYERINGKLEKLLNKFEIPFERPNPVDPFQEQIRALLLANNKIEAIKVYRKATGWYLNDAKNAVEAIERQLRGGR